MGRVVVIGGSGFLGSHTADELSSCGHEVVILDRQESIWCSKDQIMMTGDILDRDDLRGALKGADYVYLFAGIADIEESSSKPLETISLNVMGVVNTLEEARLAGVRRVIFASTMYVYSRFGSFYRASKQAAETIIEAYQEHYDLNYTLLRYGSLYGPRAPHWNGLKKYISQIVNEGKLDYFGTGSERREYIHVKDAARLSVDVLDEAHKNRAITVTGSQVMSSSDMIDLIFEISGVEKEVVFSSAPSKGYHYNMTPYRYSPQKAHKLVPDEFIDLGQGVLEMVEEIHQKNNSNSE